MLQLKPISPRPSLSPETYEKVASALLEFLDSRDSVRAELERLQCLRSECQEVVPRATALVAEANAKLAEVEKREADVTAREKDVAEREAVLDGITEAASKFSPKGSK